jgi:aspartate aminotransferase
MVLANRIKNLKPSATLAITATANELKKEGKDVIGFGAGEPDFNTPENICNAAIKAINEGKTRYTPVGGIFELRKAVAEQFTKEYGVNFAPDEILISCGGKHSLFNIFMALINKGDEVIIPSPYWVSYPAMVEIAEGKSVIIETSSENGFKLNPDILEKSITSKTKVLVINSPSNPTGSAYSEEELKAIIDVVKDKDIFIISDDIYYKITYDDYKFVNALMIYPELKDKVIIVNGVSKTYAMTGWRIGFTAANKNLISAMSKIQGQSTSNPTSFAQYGALEAITGDQSFINKMVDEFKKRRDFLVSSLNNIQGISCINAIGTFYVFPDISEAMQIKGLSSSVDFAKKLLEEKLVAVVPGSAFGKEGYIRMSFVTSMDNLKKGVQRIKEWIED